MSLLFYGHKHIAKKDYFIFDIISFYIVIIYSQLSFYYLLQINPISLFNGYIILTLLLIKSFIFKDPLTNLYGYKANSEEYSIVKNKSK